MLIDIRWLRFLLTHWRQPAQSDHESDHEAPAVPVAAASSHTVPHAA
ncbi:hypothetical protein MKOR_07110 [Mycolicibacillus koreensis]|nr:hypothetical protein MKOR_07110 [Mycolicibacillus koreensis]